eukprot:CAMPEP_0204064294 /NCGR_PEP_ID=MMETSP0360-20130528/148235_1 /ASSEMBLY_ACC=CAM_ASM_000342 /TAXON_ID=268821 /ORGANISM="Scrippsiella Hangoei, Strain SHTV-5" /LENGTH=96 /DNA_ID=CAMNT_0051012205 /DNA_START=111 /DNA_END=398 /DNA_ORIENTATION=-
MTEACPHCQCLRRPPDRRVRARDEQERTALQQIEKLDILALELKPAYCDAQAHADQGLHFLERRSLVDVEEGGTRPIWVLALGALAMKQQALGLRR